MKKLIIAFVVLAAYQCFAADEATTEPTTEPATQPAAATTGKPSTQPLITPEAQAELDQLRDTYLNLKSLDIAGVITANFDVAGQVENDKADLTATYSAPNRFRHEMKGDLLIGSTGEKVYAYKADEKLYLIADAPKPREKDFPDPIGKLLSSQNPLLLAVMSGDASAQLTKGYEKISRVEDAEVDGKKFVHLKLESADGPTDLLIDPQTHLLRRLTRDVSPLLIRRGEDSVKAATMTLDYTKVVANELPADQSFAWTPPADARDLRKVESAGAGDSALVGKPAPDFKLEDMDGKTVSLADLKDTVVVLDFWATWCGPCVVSLPAVQKVMDDLGPKGAKFFAVNEQEDKDKVTEFIKKTELKIPVLLDKEGKAGGDYGANAIPMTVVIGRDGTVIKVTVGAGQDEAIRAAAEKALK